MTFPSLTKFPDYFRFGVADADLQVTGEKIAREREQSEESMWSHFAEHSGKCHNNESPAAGVDRYTRWPEDAQLIKNLGVAHYRVSISMTRTLLANGKVNAKAITWYREYLSKIRELGIKVYATLYHWELPQYVNEKGGWKSKAAVDLLVRHAAFVEQELGDLIEEYFILNEPWCSSYLSYYLGIHAPGETDLTGALIAAHNLMLAQGAVFELLSKNKNNKVGTVLNVQTVYAATCSEADITAASYADGFSNTWFLDPIFKGKYPEHMLELYGKRMPKFPDADLKQIRIGSGLSSLGLNYYRGDIVRYDESADLKYTSMLNPSGEKNDLGWPVYMAPHYPEGLYDILQQIWFAYAPKKLYVSENGMALRGASDVRRIQFYQSHMQEMLKAISRGIPLDGFFLWTLMDNYEWAEGYRPESCFGIVEVDRTTLARTPKKSYEWYQQVIRNRSL